MFTSITGTSERETAEQIPQSSPPWIWVGFLFAAAFFLIEVLFVILDLEETAIDAILTVILIGGWIYWLFCIHRIHKILAELTRNRYPISPGEGAAKHIIPFYNFYWVFKWPAELSDYLNRRGRVRMISGYVIGAMLLLSLLLRFVDGAIGMAFLFGVTLFVSSKLKAHVKAVRGVRPDQLPPLPDPRIFSQPIETSSSGARETVEGSGVG